MRECSTCKRCLQDDVVYCPDDGDPTVAYLKGDTILDDRYQLEQRLGQGSIGIVFKARNIFLKTTCAIKVMIPEWVGNSPTFIENFREQAMATANLRHQNIASVTDFGVAREATPFLVMEYICGRTLHDLLLSAGPLPVVRALEMILPVCAGVGAAHDQGVIHGALTPRNIMVAEGKLIREAVKVLDFGLAKIKSDELSELMDEKSSGVMGAPFYMAPEQWSGVDPNARSDIYSVGIILYQMLAGDVPFKGASTLALMKKHVTDSPPAFAERGVKVPSEIEAVVRRVLEKDPDKRPSSLKVFVNELRLAAVAADPSLEVGPGGLLEVEDLQPASPQVFICHASEDKQFAMAICQTLEAIGIECWMAPRNVLPGTTYAKAIIDALKECRVMVFLISANSNSSRHVTVELDRAFNNGITIIPVQIGDKPLSDDKQYYLCTDQVYNASTAPFEDHLKPLAAIVSDHLKISK